MVWDEYFSIPASTVTTPSSCFESDSTLNKRERYRRSRRGGLGEGGALPAVGPRPRQAGGGAGPRAYARHAARLGGQFPPGLFYQVGPRAVDAAVQCQRGQGGGLAAAEGGQGGDRPLPAARPQAEGDRVLRRGRGASLAAAHQLPDAGVRQAALDEDGAEDRQAVRRLLPPRRPLAARPPEFGHHKSAGIWPHLLAGADNE